MPKKRLPRRPLTKRCAPAMSAALDAQRLNIQALIRAKAGSQVLLAAELGVTQAAVSKWLVQGFVPLQRAIEIEAIYGVPRTALVHPRLAQAFTSVDELLAG